MSLVPVTPSVVAWAVSQSGFTLHEIAEAIETPPATVSRWLNGTDQPSLGQARKLAKKLRRPLAVLLWAAPPTDAGPEVAFRAPAADEMRELNAVERRIIRQSARIQKAASWLRQELGLASHELPAVDIKQHATEAAGKVRRLLGVSTDEQLAWSSEYVAFRAWREAFEGHGILVFTLALGGHSCRGITLSDEIAPTIIVNTHWNVKARIFSLFHELGHVVTGTTSACAASWAQSSKGEHVERWCEAFAAAALMPWPDVEKYLAMRNAPRDIVDLGTAAALSRGFKVSLQAATLRLISGGRAKWSLWDAIPRDANIKSGGGAAPDEPRTTPVIRIGELGRATPALFLRGLKADLLDRSQVASHLRVSDDALADIERRLAVAENEAMP